MSAPDRPMKGLGLCKTGLVQLGKDYAGKPTKIKQTNKKVLLEYSDEYT